MAAPLFSTITLLTEIVVTASVLYAFYSGYVRNRFPYALVALTLAYETLFNVSYMTLRVATHVEDGRDRPFEIALAAFHGTFSLLMFVGLIVFMAAAWRNYRKGVNYFRAHAKLTRTFIALWLVAIASGFAFYAVEYAK